MKNMKKVLTQWTGRLEGLTLLKTYLIDPTGNFRDDRGNLRGSFNGEWAKVCPPQDRNETLFNEVVDPTQSDDPLVNPKKAYGAVKAPMHTLPPLPMVQVSNVMAGGNHKYGLYNYRDSNIDAMTYIGAIKRHFSLWEDGEDLDSDSQQSHLAHIIADCAIVLDCMIRDKLIDNRSKTGLMQQELTKSQNSFKKFMETTKGLGE